MKTNGKRILEICDYFCNTKKEFADKIGERPQTVSNWFGRHNGEVIIDKVLRAFPQVDRVWLITGEGSMFPKTNNPNSKIRLMEHDFTISVPLVNQYVQASYICGFNDENYMETLPRIPFMAGCEAEGNYVAFEVRGDSMSNGTEDSYLEGDRLICREIAPHLWETAKLHIRKWDFVIVHKDGILVRRITGYNTEDHTISVHALNGLFPDLVLNLAEVYQIFKVIELQRSRMR